jgi:hypothetical protein
MMQTELQVEFQHPKQCILKFRTWQHTGTITWSPRGRPCTLPGVIKIAPPVSPPPAGRPDIVSGKLSGFECDDGYLKVAVALVAGQLAGDNVRPAGWGRAGGRGDLFDSGQSTWPGAMPRP